MIRGVLARRHILRVYGFECSPGLRNRGLVQVEMDPAQLEHQRKQVLYIHQQLPQFQYGLEPTEDNYTEILETRTTTVLNDGSQYTGQWDKANGQRCGRGQQVWSDGSIYEGYW